MDRRAAFLRNGEMVVGADWWGFLAPTALLHAFHAETWRYARLSPRNFMIYIFPRLCRLFSPAPDRLPSRCRLRLDPPPPADGAPMSTIRHRSSLSSLTRSGGGPSSPTKHRRCRSTPTTPRAPPPPQHQHQHPDGPTDTRKGRYVSGDGSDVSSYALPTLPLLFPPKSKGTMRFRRRGRWWGRCCFCC